MTILALIAGWTLPMQGAIIWSGCILATILLPTLIPLICAILPTRSGVTVDSHLRALGDDLYLALTSSALRVVFLPHQACLMADAIWRTLVRMCVTHKHLLEWVTAAQATLGPRDFYQRMAGAPAIGVLGTVVAVYAGHGTWKLASAFAVLWVASPAIAGWISLSPLLAGHMPMSIADAHLLRLAARRTWRFFEQFVTPADNMLPPDNFQEDPAPVIAHRTSPPILASIFWHPSRLTTSAGPD